MGAVLDEINRECSDTFVFVLKYLRLILMFPWYGIHFLLYVPNYM